MTPSRNGNQEDLTVPGIALTQLRKSQVFIVLLADVFTPFLALTAFSSASAHSFNAFLQLVTLASLETLVIMMLYISLLGRFDIRISNGLSIIMHGVVTAYWFWGLRANGSLYILITGYTAIVLWRFYGTARTDSLNDLNRSSFIIDSVAAFLMSLYFYVWAMPIGGLIPTDAKPLFIFLLFVGVLLRVYWLWRGERLSSQTRAAPPWFLWILLSISLLALIPLYHWTLSFLNIAGSAVSSVLTPILAHLPFPSIHFNRWYKLPDLTPPFALAQQQHTHYLITPVLHWIYIVLTAVLVFLFLFFLLRRRTVAAKMKQAAGDLSHAEIIRRSLTDLDRNRFLKTSNPIRLRVQGWLRKQLKGGGPVSEHLSLRSMVRRSADESTELERMVAAYERERYGAAGSDADGEIRSDE